MSAPAASYSSLCRLVTDWPSHTPMPGLNANGEYGPLFRPHSFVDRPSLNELSAIVPRSFPSAGMLDQLAAPITSEAARPRPSAAAGH